MVFSVGLDFIRTFAESSCRYRNPFVVKEYSLPISLSFRLFGALLSGALVTELVYYYSALSYVLPVLVGVLFTLLHALIQAYVLTMLTSLFYGQVSDNTPKPPREKKHRRKSSKANAAA